jgi:hypothetical protein
MLPEGEKGGQEKREKGRKGSVWAKFELNINAKY